MNIIVFFIRKRKLLAHFAIDYIQKQICILFMYMLFNICMRKNINYYTCIHNVLYICTETQLNIRTIRINTIVIYFCVKHNCNIYRYIILLFLLYISFHYLKNFSLDYFYYHCKSKSRANLFIYPPVIIFINMYTDKLNKEIYMCKQSC